MDELQAISKDVWMMLKSRYNTPHDEMTDEWWSDMLREAEEILERYRDHEHQKYAEEYMSAAIGVIERKWKREAMA